MHREHFLLVFQKVWPVPLRKINANSIAMRTANKATAHLFISNPFARESKGFAFVNKMFLTHPPTEERIEALMGRDAGRRRRSHQ